MEHRTRIVSLIAVLIAVFAVPPAPNVLAQNRVFPASENSGNGPSLDATLQFIQEKLNDQGAIKINIGAQITTSRYNFNYSVIDTVSNVSASGSECVLSYHWKVETVAESNRATEFDGDQQVSLHDVKDIIIKPYAQFRNEKYVADGSPQTVVYSASPNVAILVIKSVHGVTNSLPFPDPELADRMARAITHAVQLCGGEKKDPF